jgi:O-antigen ligase
MNMTLISYKYSKATIILCALLILACFGGKQFFFDMGGIGIRPFYILLPVGTLLIIYSKYSRREFAEILIFPILFAITVLLGIVANMITALLKVTDIELVVKIIIFCIVQFMLFIIAGYYLLKCDNRRLFRSMGNILPFITLPPLLFFLFNAIRHFGERNCPYGTYVGIYLGNDGLPRATGFFDDPNYFSLFMLGVLYIFLMVSQVYSFKKKTYFFLFIGLIDVLLTTSRAALLVIATFIVLCSICRVFKKKIILMLCIAMAAFVSLVSSQGRDIVLKKLSTKDGSVEERGSLLSIGLKAPQSYPMGIGIGNTEIYYLENYGLKKIAHNDFISVLLECGILGLLCYVAIFVVLFRICKNRLARICIVCFMLHLCTLSAYCYEVIVPIFVVFTYYITRVIPCREVKLKNNIEK